MSKFVTGKDLEEAIYEIIWNADEHLLIVSPYIKLGEYFKKLFNHHENNPKLQITLVFGKNEGEVSKSLNKDDFEFFKKFPNISIVYVPNLHAKYYANDDKGIITSINLYDASFQNNIEFGVFNESKLISIATSADQSAWNYSWDFIENSDVVFVRRPYYDKKTVLGFGYSKNYVKSIVHVDETEYFYGRSFNRSYKKRKLNEFDDEYYIGAGNEPMPTREEVVKETSAKKRYESRDKRESYPSNTQTTYQSQNYNKPAYQQSSGGSCIRCGTNIQYNPSAPYCKLCYNTWAQFGNPEYQESHCHGCGKQERTSMLYPECNKCYRSNK
ncbi:hypothetical protein C3K47_18905 [Solitalea longa]|uniref:Phospholipase D-like domain-containing protein n=1 Tax=Solitalea longa TaxID=2079460 RepID=A0A2S4ZWM4_9SPHI|nr:phospholipase D family protein [Solitalea longa]POY34705.1 hypothetical protein C3K47_18905 [Solitalea longa]